MKVRVKSVLLFVAVVLGAIAAVETGKVDATATPTFTYDVPAGSVASGGPSIEVAGVTRTGGPFARVGVAINHYARDNVSALKSNGKVEAGDFCVSSGAEARSVRYGRWGLRLDSDFVAPNTGSISYGALDDLGRPTGVTARLTPDMVGTGSSASRSITPPSFGGGAVGDARGHLLGNQLGGSGADARNLVTMFQNPANSPVMRGFENQVRAALDAGQVVNYGATPIYRGTGLMPVGITLRAQGSGGLDFFVSILNRGL